jgi:hypothetical protein
MWAVSFDVDTSSGYHCDSSNVDIKPGIIVNVIGRPARAGGFTFTPAVIDTGGETFRPASFLNALPADRVPSVLRVPIEQNYDAAWVRARLPGAFGILPGQPEMEKVLLGVSFVAVRDGAGEGTAFDLTDYDGKSALTFGESESDDPLKQAIADAFWSLLLSAPEELADFQARVFRSAENAWATFGCEDGQSYFTQEIPPPPRAAKKRPNVLEYQASEKSENATRFGLLCVLFIGLGLLVLVLGNLGLMSNKESAVVETIMFCMMGTGVFGVLWLTAKSKR